MCLSRFLVLLFLLNTSLLSISSYHISHFTAEDSYCCNLSCQLLLVNPKFGMLLNYHYIT